MSLKENIDFVKKEMDSEEKFLESAIHVERFVKKYKILLLASLAAVVAIWIGYYVNSSLEQKSIKEASSIYLELLKAHSDEKAGELKSSSKNLYTLYVFQKSVENNDTKALEQLSQSKLFPVAELAGYQSAMLLGEQKSIAQYSGNKEYPFPDISALQEGYLLIKEGRYDEVKRVLDGIPINSQVKNISNMLLHYLVTQGNKK